MANASGSRGAGLLGGTEGSDCLEFSGLGIASSISLPAAVAVWGVWAIASGVPQLLTAIRNRGAGGQIAQVLSGGISVLAGGGFLYQGLLGRAMMAGVAGYATLGAVFFLVSAIVLSAKLRKVSV
ncbi:hypothetical protein ACTXJG_10680 [Glutamicibacter arilaitensis]|uniref:hypothetical protein n=1 Tax=Glutamicibacter arilaitensis TaxID=256701 RepID=UPI003F948807